MDHGITAEPVSDPPTILSAPCHVNGKDLPLMPPGLGDSYAGLLPISDKPEEERKLFFWYWKSSNAESKDLTVSATKISVIDTRLG